MKEYRVEIHWLDSGLQVHDGWSSKSDFTSARLCVVETVGFLVHEDEESYYVALTRDSKNNHYFGVQLIAKQNVKMFKRLRWQST